MLKKVKLQSYVPPVVSPIILLHLGTGDTMRSKPVMGSPLASGRVFSGWWKKTNLRTWSMRMIQSSCCWLEEEGAMCQGNRPLLYVRTEIRQQPERARKLISAPELPNENFICIIPWFEACDIEWKTSHTL